MIVETEPADLLMLRYKLYFNQQRPDPEDGWVLAYFEEWGLEPRRILHEEHEGIPYKVLHFGQCYLGRHLSALGKLYQRGIEHTVLAQHIQEVLTTTTALPLQQDVQALSAEALRAMSLTLAAQLHEHTVFETAAETLRAVLPLTTICTAFTAWQTAPPQPV